MHANILSEAMGRYFDQWLAEMARPLPNLLAVECGRIFDKWLAEDETAHVNPAHAESRTGGAS